MMDNNMPETLNMPEPMTLIEYLDRFWWTQTQLANEAHVSTHTISRAVCGETISRRNAIKIVEALERKLQSQGTNVHLDVSSIKGLQVAALQSKAKAL